MDKSALLLMYDREMRQEIEFPDQRKESSLHLTRLIRADDGMNTILYSRLETYNVEAVITEQLRYFQALKKSFTWKIYQHDPFQALKDHLLVHGLSANDPYPVMVLDLHSAAEELKKPVMLDVRRLVWPEQLDEVARVEAQVWGGDFTWLQRRLARQARETA